MNVDERIIGRLESLIAKADAVSATYQPSPEGMIGFQSVNGGLFSEWRSQSLVLLRQAFGEGHTYSESFAELTARGKPSEVGKGRGVLAGALEDVREGHLSEVRSLVAAEIFTDFLDMAAHLAAEGYKDAAASVTGAVLEDGLRRIATAKAITFTTKDGLDSLNTKLATANVYNAIVKARVNAWRVLRNAADHGNFDEYDAKQVAEMVSGVTDFLGTHLT